MHLNIPATLHDKLRQLRSRQLAEQRFPDEVFRNEEVVNLTLGLGPAMYLSLDGRIIVWDGTGLWLDNNEPKEAHEFKEIAPGIVIGAKRFLLPELLELLPTVPENATFCPKCQGERILLLYSPNFAPDIHSFQLPSGLCREALRTLLLPEKQDEVARYLMAYADRD